MAPDPMVPASRILRRVTASRLPDWASVGDLLDRIERYYDAVPRPGSRTEQIGPFTLFVSNGGWPYYARPTLGGDPNFDLAAVDRLRERQRELGVPEAIEWVDEITPDLLAVVRRSGLLVDGCPLMVLHKPMPMADAPDVTVRILGADDPALALAAAVATVSFAAGGVDV